MNIILFEEGENFFPSSDERAVHIRKVLHLKTGDTFKGGEINKSQGTAVITDDSGEGITFSYARERECIRPYPLTLIVAQTRPICMRRILRESASMGVERIILPITDLGEKSYSSSSLYTSGEYKSILLDGAMQSGFPFVSGCLLADTIEDAVRVAESDVSILLDNVIGSVPLSSLDLKGKSVTLAIGPERGWSAKEREYLKDKGYTPSILGNRILRTETAVPFSVALALSRMGLV